MTSSNLSTSLSDHERPGVPPPPPKSSSNHHHHNEVIVTDADLRSMYSYQIEFLNTCIFFLSLICVRDG
jgi:hypothetical protein